TAHVYASGLYDGTADGLERMLASFEAEIGLDRLAAIHLNDSKSAFGSRVDRHANVGDGQLGVNGLRPFFQHPALQNLPFILEVPGREKRGADKRNVDAARALTQQQDDEPSEPEPGDPDGPPGSGQSFWRRWLSGLRSRRPGSDDRPGPLSLEGRAPISLSLLGRG
ncbi:MAG: TIM barrel protein, partial [Chloroflexota bacterium]